MPDLRVPWKRTSPLELGGFTWPEGVPGPWRASRRWPAVGDLGLAWRRGGPRLAGLPQLTPALGFAGARARRRAGIWSFRSPGSVLSFLSLFSIGSALSVGSVASFASILSIGSSGSILSIGSAGSILSIGSAGSILCIGSAGGLLRIGGRAQGASPATGEPAEEAGDEADLTPGRQPQRQSPPAWRPDGARGGAYGS